MTFVIYYTHWFLLIIVLSDFIFYYGSFSRKVIFVHTLKWFSSYEFFRVEVYLANVNSFEKV